MRRSGQISVLPTPPLAHATPAIEVHPVLAQQAVAEVLVECVVQLGHGLDSMLPGDEFQMS
jgi:hypothetical protein